MDTETVLKVNVIVTLVTQAGIVSKVSHLYLLQKETNLLLK